jgi:hypothetical protein
MSGLPTYIPLVLNPDIEWIGQWGPSVALYYRIEEWGGELNDVEVLACDIAIWRHHSSGPSLGDVTIRYKDGLTCKVRLPYFVEILRPAKVVKDPTTVCAGRLLPGYEGFFQGCVPPTGPTRNSRLPL